MRYVLFIFGKTEKQEDLVTMISQDVSVMSDLGDVRYYYSPDSIILTFNCSESLESIDAFLNMLYGKMNIVYMLFPYEKDKMSLKMDEDISKHLFDIDVSPEKNEKLSDLEKRILNLLDGKLEENISEMELCEDGGDFIDEITKRKKETEPTLDELLDKINEKGISSLTEKELNLLNKYSK